MSTYLYIYESADRSEIYIGIANSMRRVWEPHNSNAEKLRETQGSRILQTVEPFSRREDARKAEAIAIYIASQSGQKVHHIDETGDNYDRVGDVNVQDNGLTYTNIAGTQSTTVLQPAIYYRPGEIVTYEQLTNTAIVRIRPEPIDNRPAPFGGLGGAQFAERAMKWWSLGRAKREEYPVEYLLAILSGKQIVLGSWKLAEPRFSWDDNENKWQFVLADPADDDIGHLKGRTLKFTSPYKFQTLGYSLDIRR